MLEREICHSIFCIISPATVFDQQMYVHLLLFRAIAVAKLDALNAWCLRGLRGCSITKKVIDSMIDLFISSNFSCQSIYCQDTEPLLTRFWKIKPGMRLSKLPETLQSFSAVAPLVYHII